MTGIMQWRKQILLRFVHECFLRQLDFFKLLDLQFGDSTLPIPLFIVNLSAFHVGTVGNLVSLVGKEKADHFLIILEHCVVDG